MLLNIETLVGKEYGKFTVIEVYYGTLRNKNGTICRCRCICGNIRDYFAADAKRKTSCGCIRNLNVGLRMLGKPAATRKDYGVSSENSFHRSYVYKAKKEGIEFSLTKEEFIKLSKQNCYYCNLKPMAMYCRTRTCHGYHIHNGVDRIDNDKGYTKENSAACCKWCNFSKNNRTEKDFLEWANRLYLHLRSQNRLP